MLKDRTTAQGGDAMRPVMAYFVEKLGEPPSLGVV
jgi:hypothetical protein